MLAAFKVLVFVVFSNYLHAQSEAPVAETKSPQFTNSPQQSYNLGLEYFDKSNFVMALAHWRKAVYLGRSETRAYDGLLLAEEKLFGQSENGILRWFTTNISNRLLYALSYALLLILSVYVIRRIKAQKPFISIGVGLLCVTYISLLGSALILNQNRHNENYATITSEDARLRSSPDIEAPEIFNIRVGHSAKVLRTAQNDNWLQVQKSNGQVGWLPSKFLIVHSGPLSLKELPSSTDKL